MSRRRTAVDVEREIAARVQEFVDDVTEIAQRAAKDMVSRALESSMGALEGGRNGARRRAPARARGAKRTPAEIAETRERLKAHLRDNPGRRMEEIAASLGASTKDLTLPLKQLVASGDVVTEGQKRATTYRLAKASSRRASSGAGRRRKKNS